MGDEVIRYRAGVIVALIPTVLGLFLTGCTDLGLGPTDPIVPLARAESAGPSATGSPLREPGSPPSDPGLAGDSAVPSEVCWAMLQDLPVMDDTGLDPDSAQFFVAWGRYMKDVDRYLSQRMPMFEALVDRAPRPEQVAAEDAMEGILRMRAAVHGAAPRLGAAREPVEIGVVRVFTVASTDFLDGLEQACPSAGLFQTTDQESLLSMT